MANGESPNPFSAFGLGHPLFKNAMGGMDWMKGLWSQPGGSPFSIPADLTELDQRIADLKAVQSWLEVNGNLLKATIQSMEVQRHTLSALQAFAEQMTGQSNAAARSQTAPEPPPAAGAQKAAEAAKPAQAEASQTQSSTAGSSSAGPFNAGSSNGQAAAAFPSVTMDPGVWMKYLEAQFQQLASGALAGASPTASKKSDPPAGSSKQAAGQSNAPKGAKPAPAQRKPAAKKH